MLSGSAIARVLLLILAAAFTAALVQHYWPSGDPASEPQVAETPRPVQPSPSVPVPAPPPVPAPAPAPSVAEPRPVPGAPEPPPVQAAPPAPVEAPPAQARAEIDAAEAQAEPRAVDLVDLNTAPVDALNRLKGGGAIGRAIVQHRPYVSVDQLLSKRVLSRAVFQRIKDQVTVR